MRVFRINSHPAFKADTRTKKMKRILSALLTLLLVFSLCACGGNKATADNNPSVTTPKASYSDLVKAVPLLGIIKPGMNYEDAYAEMKKLSSYASIDGEKLSAYVGEPDGIAFGNLMADSIYAEYGDDGIVNTVSLVNIHVPGKAAEREPVEVIASVVEEATGVKGEYTEFSEKSFDYESKEYKWIMDDYAVSAEMSDILGAERLEFAVRFSDSYNIAAKTEAAPEFVAQSGSASGDSTSGIPVFPVNGTPLNMEKLDAAELSQYIGTTKIDPAGWESSYGCAHIQTYGAQTYLFPITPAKYLNFDNTSLQMQLNFSDSSGALSAVMYSVDCADSASLFALLEAMEAPLKEYGMPDYAATSAAFDYSSFEGLSAEDFSAEDFLNNDVIQAQMNSTVKYGTFSQALSAFEASADDMELSVSYFLDGCDVSVHAVRNNGKLSANVSYNANNY